MKDANKQNEEFLKLLLAHLEKPSSETDDNIVKYIENLKNHSRTDNDSKYKNAVNSMRSFLKGADDNNLKKVIGGLKSIFPDNNNNNELDAGIGKALSSISAADKADNLCDNKNSAKN